MGARKVVHFGPANSKGGMSVMMQNLFGASPENWEAAIVNTHSERGLLSKISAYRKAKTELRELIDGSKIDLAHIHVTHGFSWWRKLRIIKRLEKSKIPMVIHIHSGKFERFCSGLAGKSVRKNLHKDGRKVVLLEERWRGVLENWVPSDSLVIHNFSEPVANRTEKSRTGVVRLLHLSRDSPGKGHDFSIRVLEELLSMGIDARLEMTGREGDSKECRSLPVKEHGWVSGKERKRMVGESDFLLSPSEFEGSSMSIIESMV